MKTLAAPPVLSYSPDQELRTLRTKLVFWRMICLLLALGLGLLGFVWAASQPSDYWRAAWYMIRHPHGTAYLQDPARR